MNYTCNYDNGKRVYSLWDNSMELSGGFLFEKLRDFGCEIQTYSYNENKVDLYGTYPKSKFVEIKKFFYDNYPYTAVIEPRTYGIRIHFKIKVTFAFSIN